MTQSRLGSLIEAVVNVLIGYGISVTAQHYIFAYYGYQLSLKQNLEMGLFFTVISIARSYAIRRFFNAHLHRAVSKLVGTK